MEIEREGVLVKEEIEGKQLSDGDNNEIGKVSSTTSTSSEKLQLNSSPKSSRSSPNQFHIKEERIASTKAEMGEAREENERLKSILTQLNDDYCLLQTHYYEIIKQDKGKKVKETSPVAPPKSKYVEEDHDLAISLSLGNKPSLNGLKKEEKKNNDIKHNKADKKKEEEGLKLGLEYSKFEGSNNKSDQAMLSLSSDNSFEETKEEKPGEPWPPSKILKNLRGVEDDLSQQPQIKKARVSVRARCDTPTMNDGCQWRKYGQKIAKGNPCPRAYYRCTVAPGCPVRKQVQRCADDMSILITTYEGTHNHQLPVSATAMASTTSAAASMLMSGSSTSSSVINNIGMTTNLHGLSFSNTSRSPQFFLPTASVSSTPSYPTITLDLTNPSQPTTQNYAANRFVSNPRYNPSTSFNFSSPESTALSTSWPNGYLDYGNQIYNKNPILGTSLNNFDRQQQVQDPFLQSYMQKTTNPSLKTSNQSSNSSSDPSLLMDSIAKAITSDPNFQSSLAAAITSYVGGNGPKHETQVRGDNQLLNQSDRLKWGENLGSTGSAYSVKPCASSYLNSRSNAPSSSAQNGSNLMFSLGFNPSSKSASASPVENREKH
ncbi:hypothetical protein LUZ60_013847 [Juncus effusus]|nr:hypothetical protein LUZ60_013847 [Juncus effusus]